MEERIEGLLMATAEKQKQIGQLIKKKRKGMGLDQADLGLEIWGKDHLSPAAAQSRISRIERGDLWPVRKDMIKIFDHLDIWDEAFIDDDSTMIRLDPEWENIIPNLRPAIDLLNDYAHQQNTALFLRQFSILCDTIKNIEDRGGGDPLARRAHG